MLSAIISAVITHAVHVNHGGLVSAPILARSPVNLTSGITANGNCKLSITCDSTSSYAVPEAP